MAIHAPTDTPPATVEVLAELLDYHCDMAIAAKADPDPETVRRLVDTLLWHMQEIGFCPRLAPAKSDFANWLEQNGFKVDGKFVSPSDEAPIAVEVA